VHAGAAYPKHTKGGLSWAKVSKAAIYSMIITEGYKRASEELSGGDQRVLQKIIECEEMRERAFMRQIDEGRVRYLGFIVLGLADAIVEVTGVRAGL
jgi:VIT1/CCC1 family predicted Fe2+/Mn2+ transporter